MAEQVLIAVVEDDPEIRALIDGLLRREGYEPASCSGAADLDRLLARRKVDLVVLDLMMAGEDGLSICRRLRAASDIPILMVTAKIDEIDRVVGLEMGADDYLGKPFNSRELIARIKAILRRSREPQNALAKLAGGVYQFGDWRLDPNRRELLDPAGVPVELTSGEFDLLRVLLEHSQRVLNRDQLLDWTRGRNSGPLDRTVDVQIGRLRKKLGDDPKHAEIIKTVRGGGYMFALPVERYR